jgi:hypothetical protein
MIGARLQNGARFRMAWKVDASGGQDACDRCIDRSAHDQRSRYWQYEAQEGVSDSKLLRPRLSGCVKML